MLHIIVGILKIIGIILAGIIGILLVFLLLGLFYPISYVLEGKKDGTEITAKGNIYWLLHAISLVIWYDKEKVEYKLRIIGIPISLQPKEHKEKSRNKKSRSKKQTKKDITSNSYSSKESDELQESSDPDELQESKAALETSKMHEEQKVLESSRENNNTSERKEIPKKEVSDEKAATIAANEQQEDEKDVPVWVRIKKFFLGIWNKIRKFKDTLKELCGKMKEIKSQISNIIALLKEEDTKAAFQLAKEQILLLVKHVKPKKISGRIHFGLEDPAATGYITGVLGAIYPILPEKLYIRPDFENEVLEGDILVKGRIQSFPLLKIAWTLYRDKNIKKIIAKLKK